MRYTIHKHKEWKLWFFFCVWNIYINDLYFFLYWWFIYSSYLFIYSIIYIDMDPWIFILFFLDYNLTLLYFIAQVVPTLAIGSSFSWLLCQLLWPPYCVLCLSTSFCPRVRAFHTCSNWSTVIGCSVFCLFFCLFFIIVVFTFQFGKFLLTHLQAHQLFPHSVF